MSSHILVPDEEGRIGDDQVLRDIESFDLVLSFHGFSEVMRLGGKLRRSGLREAIDWNELGVVDGSWIEVGKLEKDMLIQILDIDLLLFHFLEISLCGLASVNAATFLAFTVIPPVVRIGLDQIPLASRGV